MVTRLMNIIGTLALLFSPGFCKNLELQQSRSLNTTITNDEVKHHPIV